MDLSESSVLAFHRGGKVALKMPHPVRTVEDLCLAYTPGVGKAVLHLDKKPEDAFEYTAKGKTVAVISDGTAILGLGDRGPTAAIPVMEGKCVLFKSFAGVEAWPVVLDNCRQGGAKTGKTDPQRVIDASVAVAPMYGGINLEDIAAPACFEIEDKLQEILDIPVFHDDQWGTAVITLAAVRNYAEVVGKPFSSLRVAMNGAGAAGMRIREMLVEAGVKQVISCDSKGVIYKGRPDLSGRKLLAAEDTPCRTLQEAVKGADVFIGVSVAGALKKEWVQTMAPYPAIFAMANPDPEIRPEEVAEAMAGKPYVMATGRSDFPNQINNVLAFPGIFRGTFDVRASDINEEMKVAAAHALAGLISDEELCEDYIIPKAFDPRVGPAVAAAVAEAARESGVARL